MGYPADEALRHIQEVVQIVVNELIEDGEPLPQGPEADVQVFAKPTVLVTV